MRTLIFHRCCKAFGAITRLLALVLLPTAVSANSDCAVIFSDTARLACYDSVYRPSDLVPQTEASSPEAAPTKADAEIQALDSTAPAEPATVAAPAPAAVIESSPVPQVTQVPQEIAAAPEPVEEPEAGDDIESAIVEISKLPRGHLLFTLANGQVWREIEVGRSRFKKDMAVKIVRTPFGARLLKADKGRSTRVRQIK